MIVSVPFGQMQNAECKMQNECISFGNELKLCRRHTIIMHYAFSILHWVIEYGPLTISYRSFVSINARAMALMPPVSLPRIMGTSISGAKPAVKPRWSPKTKAADTAKAMFTTLPR